MHVQEPFLTKNFENESVTRVPFKICHAAVIQNSSLKSDKFNFQFFKNMTCPHLVQAIDGSTSACCDCGTATGGGGRDGRGIGGGEGER